MPLGEFHDGANPQWEEAPQADCTVLTAEETWAVGSLPAADVAMEEHGRLAEVQAGGDGNAVGLAKFDASDEFGFSGPAVTNDGAADAVAAADADDVTNSELDATDKSNAVLGKVNHLYPRVLSAAGLIAPRDR